MNTPASAFRERRVTTGDGLSLYVRDYGDPASTATPVLCLSGLTRNSRDFHALAMRLAPQRRVLAMDWRGHGRSDYDPNYQNYGFDTDMQDVLDLLAHEKIPQVIIIGTSRGGIITMWLAAHRPDVLAGAIMNDMGPAGTVEGMARLQKNFGLPNEFATFEEAALALRDRQVPSIDLTPAGWLRHARQYFRQDADSKVRPDFDPGYALGFREMKGRRDNWDQFAAMAKIPTLVVRGIVSDILDQPTVEEMKRRKPDLQVCIVPGRAHCPYLDEPESIAAIDAFLAKV